MNAGLHHFLTSESWYPVDFTCIFDCLNSSAPHCPHWEGKWLNQDLPLRLTFWKDDFSYFCLKTWLLRPHFSPIVCVKILQRHDQQSGRGPMSDEHSFATSRIILVFFLTGFQELSFYLSCDKYVTVANLCLLCSRNEASTRCREGNNVYSPLHLLLICLQVLTPKGHLCAPLVCRMGKSLLVSYSSWRWSMLLTICAKPRLDISHSRI